MTIQRQYVLPNCSLILEGLSTDASNVLSILANAEFKFVGIEQTLSGGTEFFSALVGAVSAYCQRLISGLDHPEHMTSQSLSVAVEPDEGQYHRLIVNPELLNDTSGDSTGDKAPQTIKLSTVQLFDMAEAIDQFYADTQTLPEVSVDLAPLPRKYVRAEEPLAQRAVPPLLGFGTLAVAALGLFFLPVPELAEPEEQQPETALLEDSLGEPETDAEPLTVAPDLVDAPTEPVAEGPAVEIASDRTITDSEQLIALQQQVQQQINEAIDTDFSPEQPLSYEISVAENGDIVAYNPTDADAVANLDSTPLPALTYIPVDDTAEASTTGPIAKFEVVFAPDGTVEVTSDQIVVTPEAVEPDNDGAEAADGEAEQSSRQLETGDAEAAISASGELSSAIANPIRDVDRIYELNQELRRTIVSNRKSDRSGPAVRYRVRLDEAGNITGYAATDAVAERYAADFNLANLVQPAADEQRQLDFLVVVDDDNVVQVNPWDGWP